MAQKSKKERNKESLLRKHLFLGSEPWEDDFSSMLDHSYIVDVWEGRLGCMKKISAFHSLCVRIHLGNWGMLGIISRMCTCSFGSAQCSQCVVYGPGAMAVI